MADQPAKSKPGLLSFARAELPTALIIVTLGIFQFGADGLLYDLQNLWLAGLLFAVIFTVMMWACFAVVRHADALAELLGEPYGTLILTLAVIGIEVSLIAAIMLTGEAAPTLARDTMFAVLMIVLNGLVGLALLIGALRHREQDYNLQGARAFMAVLLPLAVLSLILPKFTVSTDDPTFSVPQAVFFGIIIVLLYAAFLTVQTMRHQGYFLQPARADDGEPTEDHGHGPVYSVGYHTLVLLLTLVPIVLLSKRMAKLVDVGIVQAGAPLALGGVVIALLVLTPEGLAALAAARSNHLQRSVNLLLGSALATIGLTVPSVLAISLITGTNTVLGLSDSSMVLLLLTLVMSVMTFGGVRTNVLNGAVHCVLFIVFVVLIFSP